MSTRADLRANLRNRLEDPTPNPLWSDALLHEFCRSDASQKRPFSRQRTRDREAAGVNPLPMPPVTERDIAHVAELASCAYAVAGIRRRLFCWIGVSELKTPALPAAGRSVVHPAQLPTTMSPLDQPAATTRHSAATAARALLRGRSSRQTAWIPPV